MWKNTTGIENADKHGNSDNGVPIQRFSVILCLILVTHVKLQVCVCMCVCVCVCVHTSRREKGKR